MQQNQSDYYVKKEIKDFSECDWRANSDIAMSDEWKTYRQELRDITTQTPSLDYNYELDLTSITCPTTMSKNTMYLSHSFDWIMQMLNHMTRI